MSAKIINCKCGHGINIHNAINGCQHIDRVNNYDSVCSCWNSPQDVADAELAALRAEIADLKSVFAERWRFEHKDADGLT